ncbi:hypothetical protein Glove_168g179 [Diversispora epigaea]|uniref:Uncharacterized protein n=1 Tax=Diversispora epigaea TaxID=1348612 RepID=A0A397IPM2_9GLOM|nr:hypothetical protein Glove_168g179 [Diversispora epigaea]
MSGSKSKTRSSERNFEEESVAWKPFIKILEKPNVSNRLLEHLCTKNNRHRNWIDKIIEIWKRHPSSRIQKLADKSIKNYKVMYFIYTELTEAEHTSEKDGGHGDPLLSLCGRILCFLSPFFNGILSSQELKSQAVVSFWKNLDDLQNKVRLGEELFTMHFEGFTELVRKRSSDLTLEPVDSDKTVSTCSDLPLHRTYYAHIINLDNVANQIKPPLYSDIMIPDGINALRQELQL